MQVRTLVDTGEDTLTGGRIKRIASYIDGAFCLTYGDGVADINVTKSIDFHRKTGLKATLTAVQPATKSSPFQIQFPVADPRSAIDRMAIHQ